MFDLVFISGPFLANNYVVLQLAVVGADVLLDCRQLGALLWTELEFDFTLFAGEAILVKELSFGSSRNSRIF